MNYLLNQTVSDKEHKYILQLFSYLNIEKTNSSNFNFERLFRLVTEKHRIVNSFIQKADIACLPLSFQHSIQNYRKRQKQRALNQFAILLRISQLLNPNDYIVLKGLPLSQLLYNDFSYRDIIDIDLLVKPGYAEKVINILCNNGFTSAGEKLNTSIRHHVDLISNHIHVEVHWQISPVYPLSTDFYNQLWNEKTTIHINNFSFPVAGLRFQYLIIMIHHTKHKWEQLSWVMDIKKMQTFLTESNLCEIQKDVEKFGLKKYYSITCFVAHKLFANDSIAKYTGKQKWIIKNILKDKRSYRLMDRIQNNLYFFTLHDSFLQSIHSLWYSFLRLIIKK
jgi:hypothetical protein